jgi:hypothetical protein
MSDSDEGSVYYDLEPSVEPPKWEELLHQERGQYSFYTGVFNIYGSVFEDYLELVSSEAYNENGSRNMESLNNFIALQESVHPTILTPGINAFKHWLTEDLQAYSEALLDDDGNRIRPFPIPISMMISDTFWVTLRLALALLPAAFTTMFGAAKLIKTKVMVDKTDSASLALLAVELAEPFLVYVPQFQGNTQTTKPRLEPRTSATNTATDFYTFICNLKRCTDALEVFVPPAHWMDKIATARETIHNATGGRYPENDQLIKPSQSLTVQTQNVHPLTFAESIQTWNEWITITEALQTLQQITAKLFDYLHTVLSTAHHVTPHYTRYVTDFKAEIIVMTRTVPEFTSYLDRKGKRINQIQPLQFIKQHTNVPAIEDISPQRETRNLMYYLHLPDSDPSNWDAEEVRQNLYNKK